MGPFINYVINHGGCQIIVLLRRSLFSKIDDTCEERGAELSKKVDVIYEWPLENTMLTGGTSGREGGEVMHPPACWVAPLHDTKGLLICFNVK